MLNILWDVLTTVAGRSRRLPGPPRLMRVVRLPPSPPPEPSAIKAEALVAYGSRGRMTALEVAKLK